MLSATGSPLVAGSLVPKTTMTKKVKVVRSFYLNGKPTKVGDVIDVPDLVAFEVVTSKKAEIQATASEPAADPKSRSKSNVE